MRCVAFFFFRAEDGIRDGHVTGVQTCALPICVKEVAMQLRNALAMGADRGIRVDTADEQLDSDLVARIVAKVVEREKPDLLLMGKQAVDAAANQLPQTVAGRLGGP